MYEDWNVFCLFCFILLLRLSAWTCFRIRNINEQGSLVKRLTESVEAGGMKTIQRNTGKLAAIF